MFFGDMPTSAVAYCRVSSAQQEERETIQNQIEFATNYCKLNNIELIHIYKDDGITGTLPLNERPAGQELLRDAKEGKFKLVLVFKLDRLGRATRVILNAVHELDSYGVKVRSMTEPFDTSDASGRFLLTILAGVADLERSNILQRMELGANRAAKTGKVMGGIPPYGYIVDKDGFLAPNKSPIPNINMSEVDVVRKIYSLCLGGQSTVNIADYLNNLGVPSFCKSRDVGKRKNETAKWRSTTVYRMLKSTTYKGINRYGKNRKETIERNVPAIIDIDTWDKAQQKLKENKVMMKGATVKKQYLLRGLMKCEHCGYAYSGAFTGERVYYVDIGRHNWRTHGREKPCFGKTIKRDWIENAVWESCLEYIRNPQLVVKSIEKRLSKSEIIEQDISCIRTRIHENAKEKQRLIELYKTGLISMEDVSVEFKKVEKEKESLDRELNKLSGQLRKDDLLSSVDTATNLLELLRKTVDVPDVPFEIKRTVVQTMIDKITVNSAYDDKVRITIHFSFGDKKLTDYKSKSVKKSNTSSSASPLVKALELQKVLYVPLPYQACGKRFPK
jgi:site-specific DNA recombinase